MTTSSETLRDHPSTTRTGLFHWPSSMRFVAKRISLPGIAPVSSEDRRLHFRPSVAELYGLGWFNVSTAYRDALCHFNDGVARASVWCGGKALQPPGQFRHVPQWQKSKGSLIVTAALELSRNQITHFYSDRKNSTETCKLIDQLRRQYKAIAVFTSPGMPRRGTHPSRSSTTSNSSTAGLPTTEHLALRYYRCLRRPSSST